MCGLISIVSTGAPRITVQSVERDLRHRGPDSFGVQAVRAGERTIELGHARLAIRDLSAAGAQPMWSADRRWLIAYNGELYNNGALRRLLVAPMRGESDTETLVELIARLGVEKTLPLLNGMFAFVAVEVATGVVWAARDPHGIKPLYWTRTSDGIALASEIGALVGHGVVVPRLDPQMLPVYLQWRYVPSDRTLMQGVHRLPAGALLRFDGRELVTRWSAEHGAGGARDKQQGGAALAASQDVPAAFGQVFEDAVARQLVSDVPVGVLLSGGLDSAITAAALKRAGVVAPCFTVGFATDPGGVSEIDAARDTARLLGLPHDAVTLTTQQMIEVGRAVTRHLEEPLGTTSVLAMWHLCALARRDVTVALAGQGADEPFGGYRRHRVEALRATIGGGGRALARVAAAVQPARGGQLARFLRVVGAADWRVAYADLRAVYREDELAALGCAPAAGMPGDFGALFDAAPANGDDAARALWVDARSQLADDLLLYGDKLSMAHSLEVRVPFLDAEVVAFAEALPRAQRVDARAGKRVLKAYARSVLPASVIDRPKRGFQIPNLFRDAGFLASAVDQAQAELGPGGAGLDADAVRAALTDGARGGTAEIRAWTLHALAQWHACFIGGRH